MKINPTGRRKKWYFLGILPEKKGGGSRVPELYVKFLWPLFFLEDLTILAKSDICIPKCTERGGGEGDPTV